MIFNQNHGNHSIMQQIIKIEKTQRSYNHKKISQAYSKEINITFNCPCKDCNYYVKIVSKVDLEIFQISKHVGMNLQKKLKSEPTGLWCITDDNDEFAFFQQAYRLKGNILQSNSSVYEKEELGLRIIAQFLNENKKGYNYRVTSY